MFQEEQPADGNEADVKSLYNRFKETIGRKNNDEVYFDEDELIEIYGYAEEHFDEFVKMEVLFYGARMFPDSEFMQTRRRCMYYDLGNTEAVDTLLERASNLSTLDKILKYRQKDNGDLQELVKIIDEARSLDDEEVIEIVAELNENDHYSWLKNNYQRIAEKSLSLENTYFNICLTAKENDDRQLQMKLAEELTMLKPFSVEYLELLATCQSDDGQYSEVLSTLEYSLALDPKSVQSLILKANALARLEPGSEEAYKILLSVKDDDMFQHLGGWNLLMEQMLIRDELPKLIEMLKEETRKEDCSFEFVERLLEIDPQNMQVYAPLLKNKTWPDSPEFWFNKAAKYFVEDVKMAALILSEGFSRCRFIKGLGLYLEILYCARRFEDVIKVFRDMTKQASKMPDCVMIYILALARTGKIQKAVDEAKSYSKKSAPGVDDNPVSILVPFDVEEEGMQVNPSSVSLSWIMHAGKLMVFRSIILGLDRPEPLPFEEFDPLEEYMDD